MQNVLIAQAIYIRMVGLFEYALDTMFNTKHTAHNLRINKGLLIVYIVDSAAFWLRVVRCAVI